MNENDGAMVNAIVEAAADLSDQQFAIASVRLCERAVDTVIASFDRSAVGGNLSKAIGGHLACYWETIERRESKYSTDSGSVGAVVLSLREANDIVQSLMTLRCIHDAACCMKAAGLSVLGLLYRPDWKEMLNPPRRAFEHVALSYSSAARCMSTELWEASVRGVAQDRQIMMSDGSNILRCAPLWHDCPPDRAIEWRATVPSKWELNFVSNDGIARVAMHVIEEAANAAPALGSRSSMLVRHSAKYIAELASCGLHENASNVARQLWGAMNAWDESEAHCCTDSSASIHPVASVIMSACSVLVSWREDPSRATMLLQHAAIDMWRLLLSLKRDDKEFIDAVRSICANHRVRE